MSRGHEMYLPKHSSNESMNSDVQSKQKSDNFDWSQFYLREVIRRRGLSNEMNLIREGLSPLYW